MLLMIDNYDSFTWNLVHYLAVSEYLGSNEQADWTAENLGTMVGSLISSDL